MSPISQSSAFRMQLSGMTYLFILKFEIHIEELMNILWPRRSVSQITPVLEASQPPLEKCQTAGTLYEMHVLKTV